MDCDAINLHEQAAELKRPDEAYSTSGVRLSFTEFAMDKNRKIEPMEFGTPVKKAGSTFTRVLIVITVLLFCATIALAAVLGVREATRPKNFERTECTSKGCIKAAARISAWIDNSEKPCNNFFQFACGSWINNRVIPDEKSSLSTFSDLRDDMLVKVKRVLESNSLTGDAKSDKQITKMRKYYKNCLLRDTYGPASKLLKDIFSHTPLPHINQTGWNSVGKVEFERWLANLAPLGVNILTYSRVGVDARNTSRRLLTIDQPPVELDARRYYIEPTFEKIRTAYKNLMQRVLKKVYEDLNITGVAINTDAILKLQIQIANMTIPPEFRRDLNSTDNRWTLGQLKTSMTNFDWTKYLDQRMKLMNPPKTLADDYILMNRAPAYYAALDSFLGQFTDDSYKDTIGQLTTFLLVERFFMEMPKDYREIFADFSQVFRGTRGDDTRWKQCANYVKDIFFRDVISRIYSQEFFDKSSKTEAVEMISYVRFAFYKLLDLNTWMDKATREVAASKARKMLERIGYPDYIFDGDYLEKIYDPLPVSDGNFLNDQLKIRQLNHARMMNRLWEVVDRNEWMTQSVVVNAFYSPSFNQIYFPMGILAAPFFDKDYPKYLNYGGIGAVIGHEITHGFDDGGRQRDENGNFRPWWPDATVKSFKEAAQCIIDQYGRYKAPITIRNITLNGVQTQGENIADNGGIKQSFEGYKEWVKKRGKAELKLPGLEYTPEQLFFINYGQIWCSTMREEEWVTRILSGVHAPTMYRVIGSLSNTPYFQEAFQCRAGDRMNPPKKCSVW